MQGISGNANSLEKPDVGVLRPLGSGWAEDVATGNAAADTDIARLVYRILLGAALLATLFFISRQNYLLFHTLAEFFSIAVAWAVFMLMWNARRILQNDALLLLGIAYLFVGFIDLVHSLAYKGMGVFPAAEASSRATQLWISGRYMESFSLLLFPLVLGKRIPVRPVLGAYAAATIFLFCSIFYWGVFPTCYIEGVGLTAFKKGSEYFICMVLAAGIVLLHRRRAKVDPVVYRLMVASMLVTMGAELAFTFYVSVYGLSNLIGHYLKITSYFLIYLALVRSGLTQPYSILFRELSEAREALARRVLELDSVLGATADGILAVDREGRVLHANKRVQEMWRIPQPVMESGKSKVLLEFVLDQLEDPESFLSKVTEIYRSRETSFDILRFKDGRIFERFSSPLLLEGELLGRVWSFRDITVQRKTEEELRRLNQYFESIINSTNIWLNVLDEKSNVVIWNRAAEQVSGYSREEVVGHNKVWEWLYPDEEYRNEITVRTAAIIEGEAVEDFETTIRRKDGEIRVVSWYSQNLLDAQGRVIGSIATGRDVTETKRLEEQYIQAQKLESVGRLAAGIAHDFNNMLAVILGYTDLFLADVSENHPHYGGMLEIRKAAERSKDLIRQLLAFSRKQTLQLKSVDLREVVGDLEKMLRRTIREDIALKWLPCSAPCPVRADVGQIEQVLLNLVVNAQDAMPDGGTLTIETDLVDLDEDYAHRHPAVVPGRYVMLRVSDTGCGMDRETMQKIFEPFFTTKPAGQGTGLGLATVYGIVKQHGGNIWVYSEPGQGTEFKIYLPSLSETVQAESETAERAQSVERTGTILVVEDDPAVLRLVSRILEGEGYRVIAAESGEQAVEQAERCVQCIDVLLTDVVMRGMRGPDVYRKISRFHPQVKVIYMSGYSEEVISPKGILQEGVELIRKPFSRKELLAKVVQVLNARPAKCEGRF